MREELKLMVTSMSISQNQWKMQTLLSVQSFNVIRPCVTGEYRKIHGNLCAAGVTNSGSGDVGDLCDGSTFSA